MDLTGVLEVGPETSKPLLETSAHLWTLRSRKGQDVVGKKTCISVVLQTVKLHPSIWEPLFLTRVQGVLLSGGNTPRMSQQSIVSEPAGISSPNNPKQKEPRGNLEPSGCEVLGDAMSLKL